MRQVQQALAPTGIPCYAGAWRRTAAVPEIPATYIAYKADTHESEHYDDRCTKYWCNVYLNLFVVFLLTGIWHGANWTFAVWGIINGLFVVLERYLRDKKWYTKIPDTIKWLCTTAVVFFSWIIFMSPDIGSAMGFYKTMFTATSITPNFTWKYYLTAKTLILLIIAAVGSVIGAFSFTEKAKTFVNGNETATAVKCILYLALFVISVLFVVNSTYSPFLYFQF